MNRHAAAAGSSALIALYKAYEALIIVAETGSLSAAAWSIVLAVLMAAAAFSTWNNRLAGARLATALIVFFLLLPFLLPWNIGSLSKVSAVLPAALYLLALLANIAAWHRMRKAGSDAAAVRVNRTPDGTAIPPLPARKASTFSIVFWVLAGLIFIGLPATMLMPCRSQTKLPLTRDEVSRKFSIVLPEGADDCYYYKYGQWQARMECIRFRAPLSVCKEYAGRFGPYEMTNIIDSGSSPISSAPDWFDVGAITNGESLYRFRTSCWIDYDRSIVFMMHTD